jgi:NADH-quinone oxidoreductase subunit N
VNLPADLTTDLLRILPEIVLAGFGILIMVSEPFLDRRQRHALGWIALMGTVAALAACVVQANRPGFAFGGLVAIDGFSIYFHFLLVLITMLAVLGSFRYLDRENMDHGEYYALLLFATIGMGFMASANELILLFLSLETSSLATYVLVGFRRADLKANEAAMKYFLLGSFATAFLLYGIALLFGATGTTFLPELASALRFSDRLPTLALGGMGLLFVGLAFKVASAPFQVWTPDVYEGAPTPVTAFLSVGPKAATFAAFLRILITGLEPADQTWFWVLWVSAVLTMFVGNLGALVQTNIKRMLAYSSIAHAGYILVAFAAGTELGVAAALFYLAAYALMKLGAFSLVSHVSAGEANQAVDDYAGLYRRAPALALCLAVFMFSLIGIPLTGGFFGKFYVFIAAVKADAVGRPLVWLVVLAVINSALSAAYYLRVLKVMFMDAPASEAPLAPVPASLAFVLTLTALGTLYLGVLPGPVLRWASNSILTASLP